MPTPRPHVDLSRVAAVLDRVLEHPVAQIAEQLLPQTARAVRAAAADLPAMASGLEARAVAHVAAEAASLEQEILGGVQRWIQDTLRAGRGQSPVRRLGPKKAARKARKGKAR